jgi:hypothetical protein
MKNKTEWTGFLARITIRLETKAIVEKTTYQTTRLDHTRIYEYMQQKNRPLELICLKAFALVLLQGQ